MNDVSRWLRSGAGTPEGLRLLSIYAPNPHLERIVRANPVLFGKHLVAVLTPFADAGMDAPLDAPAGGGRRFRDEWPFLGAPRCPVELKILANDKITAYHNSIQAHGKLFDCVTPEECFETANFLLENFTENRHITSEFLYYKEHGTVLGKHPIFQESRKYDSYRKMGPVSLMDERRRLRQSIWRAESEIRRGDKPHLKSDRERRIKVKRDRLAVVEGMIADLEKKEK